MKLVEYALRTLEESLNPNGGPRQGPLFWFLDFFLLGGGNLTFVHNFLLQFFNKSVSIFFYIFHKTSNPQPSNSTNHFPKNLGQAECA